MNHDGMFEDLLVRLASPCQVYVALSRANLGVRTVAGEVTAQQGGVATQRLFSVVGTGADADGQPTVTLRYPDVESVETPRDAVFTITLQQFIHTFAGVSTARLAA